jgi:hypothetical protein
MESGRKIEKVVRKLSFEEAEEAKEANVEYYAKY